MNTPNLKDYVDLLQRQEQVILFRFKKRQISLNAHLNRIKQSIAPTCLMCNNSNETVTHHLLECRGLNNLRQTYLTYPPNIENTLYADTTQLTRTCGFTVCFELDCDSRRVTATFAGDATIN
jgi:hypothetical protein